MEALLLCLYVHSLKQRQLGGGITPMSLCTQSEADVVLEAT